MFYYKDKSRMMVWVRHLARMGISRNVYTIVDGKRETKVPPGRLKLK
jgi:hypothetical protein